MLDLLQLADLGDWLTSEPIAIAKEIGSSDWLALVPPLELGDRVTHTQPRELRVRKGWFPRENRGVVPTERRMDVGLDSSLLTCHQSSQRHILCVGVSKIQPLSLF